MLALLALLWGGSYSLIKVALDEIPPLSLIAIRVTLAALFLFAILRWQAITLPLEAKLWAQFFIQSIFNSIGAWTILAWGQQFIDSALASVLNSTSPIFVFCIVLFLNHSARNKGRPYEKAPMRKLSGALLGIFGVALIFGFGKTSGLNQSMMGQLACLLGALLYALAAIYGKNFSSLPALLPAFGTMAWATLCLIPAALIIDKPWTLSPSHQALGAALVLGVLCTGVALTIYFRLVRTLGAMGVASQSYLRAAFGAALGILLLGEQLSITTALGLAIIIIGVGAINMPAGAFNQKTHLKP